MIVKPDNIIGSPEEDAIFSQGKQIQPRSCAVNAQCFILNMFGQKVSEQQLIEEGIKYSDYDPNIGTTPDKVGNLLVRHGIEVNRYTDASIGHLIAELAQGHKVIVGVDGGELLSHTLKGAIYEKIEDIFKNDLNHALVVTGVELDKKDPKIIVSDPYTGEPIHKYPISQFYDAWKDGNYFMVATKDAPQSWNDSNYDIGNKIFSMKYLSMEDFIEQTQHHNINYDKESFKTSIENLSFCDEQIKNNVIPNEEWTTSILQKYHIDNNHFMEGSELSTMFHNQENYKDEQNDNNYEGSKTLNSAGHIGEIGETNEESLATLGSLGHVAGIGETNEESLATLGSLGHVAGIGETDEESLATLGNLGHISGIGETDEDAVATLGNLGHISGIGETDEDTLATLGNLGHISGIGETDEDTLATLGNLGHISGIGETDEDTLATLGSLGHLSGIDVDNDTYYGNSDIDNMNDGLINHEFDNNDDIL